jgi:hypothetical protein
MRVKIQTALWVILITLSSATVILSQETQPISFAKDSVAIPLVPNGEKAINAPDCEEELKTANSRLLKTLDALAAAESAVKALHTEIEARKRLDLVNEELLKRKDDIISQQEKLIKILEKETGRKISILFGLIKIRF